MRTIRLHWPSVRLNGLQYPRDAVLKPHEVLLSVTSTGLNFRDVLNMLGMYPGQPGPPGELYMLAYNQACWHAGRHV